MRSQLCRLCKTVECAKLTRKKAEMDEYCPLCRKMGNDKKIMAIQINYDEAVWLCEDEKCPWPFGFEEFKFMPRNFQVLSKKPLVKIETRKRKESTSISTELGLYTPPVTPSNEVSSKDASTSSNSSTNTYNYNGKISPKCASNLVSNSQKNDNSPILSDEKSGDLISSIFDIDSSVSVDKSELTPKQGTGSRKCDNKVVKLENDRKPNAIIVKNAPQIRSIEAFPNSFIKIEVIDQTTNFSSPSDNSGDKSRGSGCIGKLRISPSAKRPSLAIENKINFIDEVPKKISNISNEVNEEIVDNQSFTLNENFNSLYNCENQMIKETNSQSNNYSGIIDFDNENNLIENSGQVNFGLNGLLDEMLMENCHNASQVIDDDWLTSMLL